MWDRQFELQGATPSQYCRDDLEDVAAQMIASMSLRRYRSLDEVAAVVALPLFDDSSSKTTCDIDVAGGAT